MKKTGAILLSVFLVMVMTVTNMAGAYQSAARVYAAQEDPDVDGGEAPAEMQGDTTVDGGEADNTSTPPAEVGDTQQDDGSNIPPTGGNAEQTPPDPATVLTMPTPESNTATPETLPQEVSPVPAPEIQTAPEQGEGILSAPEQENISPTPQVFTVTFDANGHGSAPAAVSAEASKSITKPNEPTAEGYTFCGWFRDTAATVVWNFDTDTVSENITLYAGWTENAPVEGGNEPGNHAEESNIVATPVSKEENIVPTDTTNEEESTTTQDALNITGASESGQEASALQT
ncbi:MAG: InlB B-repeat-containing protein, partial [Lachnospiraceae bacterium]|nr:InlB B-repeat-containing protein [Lachnospiraceae bacterium]